MIFNSIRWRIQIWHGLILVAVLTGFGLSAYHFARDNQLRRIDHELDRQLMSLLPPPPPPGRPPGPPGIGPENFSGPPGGMLRRSRALSGLETNSVYFVLWASDGSVLDQSPELKDPVPFPFTARPERAQDQPQPEGFDRPPGPARRPPPVLHARTRGEFREVFRFMPGGGCALVGASMAADAAAMQRLALWLSSAGAGILMLGLAGGWWLATRAIRPIETIGATAAKIAAGDLSQRVDAAYMASELGRLATVLNSTFARLESAFSQQARFTSDASHELRTPVSVILSQTQTTLSRERAPQEYREALEACQRSAQRMRALIESLLELARLDAGQESMKREPFDLARVARECVEFVRPLAAERNINMICLLSSVECFGNAERIAQVITNLLTNAIHFNHEKGEIRISTRTASGIGTLEVADTGDGIPPEDLPHLFERFYRVDKSRSRIQGRTGLGLAICKAILDAHGGNMSVSSQPGAGSVFSFNLPLAS